MRRWLIFIFLADLAATPFLIGAFSGSGAGEQAAATSPRIASTSELPSLDACDLLNGSAPGYEGIVDYYSDLKDVSGQLGIESRADDC